MTRAGTEGYMAPEVERCPLKTNPGDNKDDPRYSYSAAVVSARAARRVGEGGSKGGR